MSSNDFMKSLFVFLIYPLDLFFHFNHFQEVPHPYGADHCQKHI